MLFVRSSGIWSKQMYDFRSIHLGENNIASFALKADAKKFAKERGWPQFCVIQGFNRFCIFWTVGQYFPNGETNVLTRDGKTITVWAPIRA